MLYSETVFMYVTKIWKMLGTFWQASYVSYVIRLMLETTHSFGECTSLI